MATNIAPTNANSQLTITDAIMHLFKLKNKSTQDAQNALNLIETLIKSHYDSVVRDYGNDNDWKQFVLIDETPIQQNIILPSDSVRLCFGATGRNDIMRTISIEMVPNEDCISIQMGFYPDDMIDLSEVCVLHSAYIYFTEIATY